MRVFVAIELSEDVKRSLWSVSRSLSMFGDGSFCPKEGYHLTLAFIGETDKLPAVIAAMESVNAPPFTLTTEDMGSFGSTYYVAVTAPPALAALQRAVSTALSARDIKVDSKAFVPHITLVRRFNPVAKPVVFVPLATQRVTSISLMETVGQGVYKCLYRKELTAAVE